MDQLIFFEPIYQERVWGGRKLAEFPERRLPEGEAPIGESWEIVDREQEQSVVCHGVYRGLSLRELREQHGAEVFGEKVDLSRPFPILVKWLDCRERLSLQVHPPKEVAESLDGEPKTENWYIAQTDPGAAILAGLRKGVTRTQFEQALEKGELEPLIHRMSTEPGDSILVESGRIHAIDAGNLILEIQQNSDTTYRVYDWGRVGLDGQPRDLHIRESLICTDFQDFEPSLVKPGGNPQILAEADEFRITHWELSPEEPILKLAASPEARIGHLVRGRAESDESPDGVLTAGSNFLIPAGLEVAIRPLESCTFLLTDHIF